MGNILGHNGTPLGINGVPIAYNATGTDTSDATISSNSQLLYPYTSYGNGIKYTGSIQSQAAQTLYPSTSDQTITSSKYLTGAQTIKGVLLTNLTADNIKEDVVVKVGDSVDDDRITSITGTYTGVTPPYSVAILLTNPKDSEYFYNFNIYEQITSEWEDFDPSDPSDPWDEDPIGSFSSPTGATIVKINTSSYGFFCEIYGGPSGAVWPDQNYVTCTGGVTYVGSNPQWGFQVFQVTGDGTVIIDGIEWDD